MQEINIERRNGWNLNQWIVLFALGGLLGLLLEIRYTHREVLGEHPLSWTPLIYSGLMLAAGILALIWWNKGGRKILFWCFAVGLLVGPMGLYLHTMKHPVRGIARELSAWSMPINGGDEAEYHHKESESPNAESGGDQSDNAQRDNAQSGGEDEHHGDHAALEKPPVLAPLSFFGLGVLGMLACAARFQPQETLISSIG